MHDERVAWHSRVAALLNVRLVPVAPGRARGASRTDLIDRNRRRTSKPRARDVRPSKACAASPPSRVRP